MVEFLSNPWPWYVSGPLITLIMILMLYSGKTFGVSSNLRSMCSIMGAGRKVKFFKFNWRENTWNLIFALGLILGGIISTTFLANPKAVELSSKTEQKLHEMNIMNDGLAPAELFSIEAVFTLKGFLILLVGGFLIGFGARYAGGCTSGHAIMGLSNLQIPSLVAVIGFFIGGLAMVHLLFPLIF